MPDRLLKEEHRRTLLFTILLSIIIFLALSIAGASLLAREQAQKETSHTICVAVNNLNRVIDTTLTRSKRNIPRLAYYKHHPSELRAQIREVNRTLRLFRPRTCK
jgi:hypothetical protein